jgi:hypothetical protein
MYCNDKGINLFLYNQEDNSIILNRKEYYETTKEFKIIIYLHLNTYIASCYENY